MDRERDDGGQRTIFDALEGERRRDEAIHRVDLHADGDWKDAALRTVRSLAASRTTFTTDDVWKLLAGAGYEVREPRAMGAVMRRVAGAGLIRATDHWALSKRPECHRRPVRIWESIP